MPVRRPRTTLAALAASLVVALSGVACSDATGPLAHVVGGTYVLHRANGQPLPYVVSADGGWRTEIVGETLEFRPHGLVRRTRTLRSVGPDGAGTTNVVTRRTYYRAVTLSPTSEPGAALRVGSLFPCPPPLPNALSMACDPDEEGVALGDAVRLASITYGAMSATPLALDFHRASIFR